MIFRNIDGIGTSESVLINIDTLSRQKRRFYRNFVRKSPKNERKLQKIINPMGSYQDLYKIYYLIRRLYTTGYQVAFIDATGGLARMARSETSVLSCELSFKITQKSSPSIHVAGALVEKQHY